MYVYCDFAMDCLGQRCSICCLGAVRAEMEFYEWGLFVIVSMSTFLVYKCESSIHLHRLCGNVFTYTNRFCPLGLVRQTVRKASGSSWYQKL